jgi:hypothetical protein
LRAKSEENAERSKGENKLAHKKIGRPPNEESSEAAPG